MDEYISREELLTRLWKLSISDSLYGRGIERGVEIAENLVKSMPYIEVVRCKDCVYEDTTSCPLCYIEKHTLQFINHDVAFYCAKGERKDGAGE